MPAARGYVYVSHMRRAGGRGAVQAEGFGSGLVSPNLSLAIGCFFFNILRICPCHWPQLAPDCLLNPLGSNGTPWGGTSGYG